MNKLKNGVSAKYVRFGYLATVSLIDNGRWNLAISYMFLTVFLSDFFFDFICFSVGRKKIIKLVISPPDKTSFKLQGKYNIFCSTFTV